MVSSCSLVLCVRAVCSSRRRRYFSSHDKSSILPSVDLKLFDESPTRHTAVSWPGISLGTSTLRQSSRQNGKNNETLVFIVRFLPCAAPENALGVIYVYSLHEWISSDMSRSDGQEHGFQVSRCATTKHFHCNIWRIDVIESKSTLFLCTARHFSQVGDRYTHHIVDERWVTVKNSTTRDIEVRTKVGGGTTKVENITISNWTRHRSIPPHTIGRSSGQHLLITRRCDLCAHLRLAAEVSPYPSYQYLRLTHCSVCNTDFIAAMVSFTRVTIMVSLYISGAQAFMTSTAHSGLRVRYQDSNSKQLVRRKVQSHSDS